MDIKLMILSLLCSSCAVLGQKKGSGACPPFLKCPAVKCLIPVTFPGRCCPICPPAGKRPGKCPAVTRPPNHCTSICTGDFECGGNQKCCSNGCGYHCMDPVTNVLCGADVYCPQVYCDGQYRPPGKCCNVCPPQTQY